MILVVVETMLKLKHVLQSVGLAKLDPNVPPGLEYFSNLTDVLIKPYDAAMDEDFPFLSYFSGKKLKISGNDEQVLFYAVRSVFEQSIFCGLNFLY